MPEENRCPTCGARLSEPGQKCPFCADAQKLLEQLVSKEDVRICVRCGALVEEENEELCKQCRTGVSRPRVWGREDRIVRWIQDHVEETDVAEDSIPCPHCGQSVFSLTIFCPHCGKKIPRMEEEAVPVASAEEEGGTAEAEPAPAPAEEVAETEPAPAPAEEVAETEPAPAPAEEVAEAEPAPAPAEEPSTGEEEAPSAVGEKAPAAEEGPLTPPVQEWEDELVPELDRMTDTRPLPVEQLMETLSAPSFGERLRTWFQGLRRMAGRNMLIWIVLIVMVLVLVGLFLVWRWLLSSGTITLR